MTRFFLNEDGTIDRGSPAVELPVSHDLGPQVIRFHYGGCTRVVQVVTLAKGAGFTGANLHALELWNSRDGMHGEGVFKAFKIADMIGVVQV